LSGPGDWQAVNISDDGSAFDVMHADQLVARLSWGQLGQHSVANALAVIAAAADVGVDPAAAVAALAKFTGVKRRLELLGEVVGIEVYDDFAHHPTAIETTLAGLKARQGEGRIVAVIEPRSNTMRMGTHRLQLGASATAADQVIWYQPVESDWDLSAELVDYPKQRVIDDIDVIIAQICANAERGDIVVIMSNGSFGGIHQRLLEALKQGSGTL
jgi:UDP-N-acetylmuramate: L-alanyl-gamma-D-glutamyl-meso-diaminopimelate ligase